MTDQELVDHAVDLGFAGAAVVNTENIIFNAGFREYCKENLCGQYAVNYSCPPDCGTPEEMREKIRSYPKALVLQTIWEISDYGDKPSIKKAKSTHNAIGIELTKYAREHGLSGFFVGASGCALCTPCGLQQGQPCRFPDLRYSCMSAYCIFVKKLADQCGLEYDAGSGLLSFFGMFVFKNEN